MAEEEIKATPESYESYVILGFCFSSWHDIASVLWMLMSWYSKKQEAHGCHKKAHRQQTFPSVLAMCSVYASMPVTEFFSLAGWAGKIYIISNNGCALCRYQSTLM